MRQSVWGCLFVVTLCCGCTTVLVGKNVSEDGSLMSAHSNDGAGAKGFIHHIAAADHLPNATRKVHYGSIPQVPHTYAYHTEGYAAMNQFQVGLAESTCAAVFKGKTGLLDIVDLGQLALERARTAREAVTIMGALAEKFGYRDNGESLLVSDPHEGFIFHVLPDDTGGSAVWVAQHVPEDHVAAVANMFTIREVDLKGDNFLFSDTMLDVAKRTGRWHTGTPFDFTRVFATGRGPLYYCGRRMWAVYRLLAPNHVLPTHWRDFIVDAPMPAVISAPLRSVNLTGVFRVMRDYYQGTEFDMTVGLAGGAWGTPDRWDPGAGEAIVHGSWERTIAVHKSIVTYVLQSRHWLPHAVGGTVWFAPTAAHTSCYVPFPVGMASLPAPYTDPDFVGPEGEVSAWKAFAFMFNIAQLKFSYMIQDISEARSKYEREGLRLQAQADASYKKPSDMEEVTAIMIDHAVGVVSAWWDLKDRLIIKYDQGYCNGPGCPSFDLGYPAWWLRAVNYTGTLPPAPPPSPSLARPQLDLRQCVRACATSADAYDARCVDSCIKSHV